jgi:hypothetical protein
MLPWAKAPRLRERQHWRGRSFTCGGRGGGACVYAAAVLLSVAHIVLGISLANVCACFAFAPPRCMAHRLDVQRRREFQPYVHHTHETGGAG